MAEFSGKYGLTLAEERIVVERANHALMAQRLLDNYGIVVTVDQLRALSLEDWYGLVANIPRSNEEQERSRRRQTITKIVRGVVIAGGLGIIGGAIASAGGAVQALDSGEVVDVYPMDAPADYVPGTGGGGGGLNPYADMPSAATSGGFQPETFAPAAGAEMPTYASVMSGVDSAVLSSAQAVISAPGRVLGAAGSVLSRIWGAMTGSAPIVGGVLAGGGAIAGGVLAAGGSGVAAGGDIAGAFIEGGFGLASSMFETLFGGSVAAPAVSAPAPAPVATGGGFFAGNTSMLYLMR